MNDCAKIQEMISAMLDGEISAGERAAIEAHIALCPECAAMYADFTALSEGMVEMCEEVPAALHDKIMNGVHAASKPKKGLLISLRPYMSAAACLVVIVGAIFALRDSRNDIKWLSNTADTAVSVAASAPAAAADSAAFDYYSFQEAKTESFAEESVEADDSKRSDYGTAEDSPAAAEPAAPMEVPADTAVEEPAEDMPAEETENGSENISDCDGDVYIPEIIPGDHESLTAHFLALFDIGLTANDIEFTDGLQLENVYIAVINAERDAVEVHAVGDTVHLISALKCAETEISFWPMYSSALIEFEYKGEYYCFPIYFDGEKLIVTTIERSYYAAASVEELLSIK